MKGLKTLFYASEVIQYNDRDIPIHMGSQITLNHKK